MIKELVIKLESLDPSVDHNEISKMIALIQKELKKIRTKSYQSKIARRPQPKTHLLHGYGGYRFACSTYKRNTTLVTTDVKKTTCPTCLKRYNRSSWAKQDHETMLEWAQEAEQSHVPITTE
jgi:hypothetical protein